MQVMNTICIGAKRSKGVPVYGQTVNLTRFIHLGRQAYSSLPMGMADTKKPSCICDYAENMHEKGIWGGAWMAKSEPQQPVGLW